MSEDKHDFDDRPDETVSDKQRAWVFTLNNYTEENVEAIKRINCKYIVFGYEVAPSTGTPHLQGFIYITSGITQKSLRKKITGKPWVQVAKASASANRLYCTKGGQFYENGQIPSQGKRSDLEVVREMLTEGKSIREIVTKSSNFQCVRMAETLAKYFEPDRKGVTEIIWVYGKSGLGKTYAARQYLSQFGDVHQISHYKWWDGYDAHKNVIIDDFREDNWPYVFALRVLDIYPFRVEVKGLMRQFLADRIIVTSPKHPREYFSHMDEDSYQIVRRCTKIIEMTEYAKIIFSD